MRPIPRRGTWVVPVVIALALTGCGDEASEPADAATSNPSSTGSPTPGQTRSTPDDGASATTEAPETETSETEDGAVEVEIEIEGGDVTPAGAQVDATVGDQVVLQVDSDTPDELHVHSAPTEHDYAVRAAEDQQFRFTVEQPGQFDVELHNADVLVAQLVVRP